MSPIKNIIIRMPNWLGDLVMATPIIADVKRAFPESSLTAMCQGKCGELLLHNPHLDEIFSFKRPNEFLRREESRNLIERIRQGNYDLGILLPNSLSSAWWFWRGHVARRIGFRSDGRSFLLTDPIPFPKERGQEHLVNTYKRLLEPLNIPLSDTQPQLYISEKEREEAEEILRQQEIPQARKLVGINPGAAYGSAKCWLPERFCEVTKRLLEDPEVYVVYFGDASTKPLVDSVCRDLPARVVNLAGDTTLRQLVALIGACDAFLTNDSGPMHIAAALKTPLVALFGSTNDTATGPYNHGIVIHKRVSCSPCYKRTCPIDFKCMKQISTDEVTLALRQLLFSTNSSAGT